MKRLPSIARSRIWPATSSRPTRPTAPFPGSRPRRHSL
jgi:hypothetical protein